MTKYISLKTNLPGPKSQEIAKKRERYIANLWAVPYESLVELAEKLVNLAPGDTRKAAVFLTPAQKQ